ncbi:MAG: DpnI domain-containing protein [bacterium]|nr:DpnI domain-containing protein [bacterium]
MNLTFDLKILPKEYKSPSKKIGFLTENWVDKQIFCPNCGELKIDKYGYNRPVADFFCSRCKEEYELKSKKDSMGSKILDGAYRTMVERLQASNNPNFFFLNYDKRKFEVVNFFVIPKHFFTPDIIEKRKPLSENARRAGYVGCNILTSGIPQSGKIFYIKNGNSENKEDVLKNWQRTLFLREEKEISAKGWLLDVMMCVDRLGHKDFSLDEIYKFENELSGKHPDNRHIKDKIRQQLQILRDKGYLNFVSRGCYRLM